MTVISVCQNRQLIIIVQRVRTMIVAANTNVTVISIVVCVLETAILQLHHARDVRMKTGVFDFFTHRALETLRAPTFFAIALVHHQ